jgi:hypothetical protein
MHVLDGVNEYKQLSKNTLSVWVALMVKEDDLLQGKRVRGEAESPLGETSKPLVKLDLSWLAIGEALAMMSLACSAD